MRHAAADSVAPDAESGPKPEMAAMRAPAKYRKYFAGKVFLKVDGWLSIIPHVRPHETHMMCTIRSDVFAHDNCENLCHSKRQNRFRRTSGLASSKTFSLPVRGLCVDFSGSVLMSPDGRP